MSNKRTERPWHGDWVEFLSRPLPTVLTFRGEKGGRSQVLNILDCVCRTHSVITGTAQSSHARPARTAPLPSRRSALPCEYIPVHSYGQPRVVTFGASCEAPIIPFTLIDLGTVFGSTQQHLADHQLKNPFSVPPHPKSAASYKMTGKTDRCKRRRIKVCNTVI